MSVQGSDELLVAWRRRVADEWGPRAHWHTLDETGCLLRAMLDGRVDPVAGFTELGRRCGNDGHALDDVMGWMDALLGMIPRRKRRLFDQRAVAVALADGWADGMLERRHRSGARLPGVELLHLRLSQHYDQCAALGVDPSALAAIAVLDADVRMLPARARAIALTELAARATREFTCGETICVTNNGRVLVLAARTAELAATVRSIVEKAEASALLAGARVHGWVEPVPPDRQHLESHLADLTR